MTDKKTKILIILTTRFGANGITHVMLNYYWALDKSSLQIDFVVPNGVDRATADEINANGSKIYVIGKRVKQPFTYWYKLYKVIKSGGYDIVHAHGNSSTLLIEMYAAKKANAPVRIPHSHSSSCKYKMIHKLLSRFFYRSFTHAFACSEKAGKWLYADKNFQVINNGINILEYSFNQESRDEYRKAMGLTNKKVIGHIGHFTYPKNHSYLIEVFAEIYKTDRNYRLLLIGDGALKKDIKKKANDYNLNEAIIFTGNRADVPQLMSVMDLFVLPSHFEGLPLSLIEAQASCLPCVVSSNVTREIEITKLVHFISLEKSPKEWATTICKIKLQNRDELRGEIQKNIINAGYSIMDNAYKLEKLYMSYL